MMQQMFVKYPYICHRRRCFPLLKLFEEWIEILYNVARTRTPRNTAEKQSETENLVHKLHSSFILYLVKQI
jgi:hypothetical protein